MIRQMIKYLRRGKPVAGELLDEIRRYLVRLDPFGRGHMNYLRGNARRRTSLYRSSARGGRRFPYPFNTGHLNTELRRRLTQAACRTKIPPVLRLGLTLMAQVSATVAIATARPAYLPIQRLCKRKEGSRQTCKNSLFYFLFCCMI